MAEYQLVSDIETGECCLDEVFGGEKDEDDPMQDFYYYEELDDDETDFYWSEMSYRRYGNTNRWSSLDIEPTEEELYLAER